MWDFLNEPWHVGLNDQIAEGHTQAYIIAWKGWQRITGDGKVCKEPVIFEFTDSLIMITR